LVVSVIRTLIMYVVIYVLMRIMGKRQLGELEPAEFVVAVLISDIAAYPIQDVDTPLLSGLLPTAALVCCQMIISGIILKSSRFRAAACGTPSLIIENGRLMQEEMRSNRMTIDEIQMGLRKNGILDISSVKYAVLETDGTISTILYPSDSPVTAEMMKIDAGETAYPVTVISDGKVILSNLSAAGHDKNWLARELAKRNARSPEDVFFMSVDGNGCIHYEPKEETK